jgi:hypothetical protein
MRGITGKFGCWMTALLRREPARKFGGGYDSDWLPPVLGPGDWSSAVMASMADRDAAWYFDRRQDDPSAQRIRC